MSVHYLINAICINLQLFLMPHEPNGFITRDMDVFDVFKMRL